MKLLPRKNRINCFAVVIATLAVAGVAPAQATEVADQRADGDTFKIRSFDGAYIEAHVRKPDGEGPFPAVLFLHGGNGGAPEGWMQGLTHDPLPEFFLENGFVIMASDYRRYHFGVEEMYDVYAAYEKLESLPYVDPKRISAIGGSHGGYLVELLAMHKKPACVVSMGGLVDIEALYDRAQKFRKSFSTQEDGWTILTMDRAEWMEMKSFQEDAEQFKKNPVAKNMIGVSAVFELALRFEDDKAKYTEISPLQNAERIQVPLLYISGDQDPLTVNGKKLVEKLQELGKTAELSVHPGVNHGFYWGQGQMLIDQRFIYGWSWTSWEEPPAEYYKAAEKMLSFVKTHSK